MKNVLHIISSARGSQSYSKGLSSAIVKKLMDQHAESAVVERNLADTFPPFINEHLIGEFYKAPDNIDDAGKQLLKYADTIFNEVKEADLIVIGTPMHNLGISAPLKAWIDQLIRFGITYGYNQDGTRNGFLTGKKVYLAIAMGGKIRENSGPDQYISDYIKAVFSAYTGITDVSTFCVAGTVETGFDGNYEDIIQNL